jgi:hypothetical protein
MELCTLLLERMLPQALEELSGDCKDFSFSHACVGGGWPVHLWGCW